MMARVLVIAVLVLANTALAAPVATGAKTAQTQTQWTYNNMRYLINIAAAEFGQSAYWMGRVLWCESNWNPNITSWSGYAGIAQFSWQTFNYYSAQLRWTPGTWRSPYNPRVATRTMAYMWWLGQARQWECAYIVGYLR